MAGTLVAALKDRKRLRRRWLWVWGLTAFIAAGATAAAIMGQKTGPGLAFAVVALAVLMIPYLACATTSFGRDLRLWLQRSPTTGLAQVALFFIVVYLFYAAGTGAFDPLALTRVAGFVGIPTALALSAGQGQRIVWQDWAIVACIWLPFNFGLLDSIWTWPEGEAAYVLNTPMAVDLALLLFIAFRRFSFVPFRFRLKWRDLIPITAALAGFMAIALPIGLGTGFLTVSPKLELTKVIGAPLGIFFFIAVPEELLFRGLLQGMLLERFGKPVLALVVASVLFGASHWHNPGLPDFRYLGLASVAGIFYGWTYMRTRSVAASALLHAAVDTLWELFFHT